MKNEIFISFDGNKRDDVSLLAEKIKKILNYDVFVDKYKGDLLQKGNAKSILRGKIFNARKVILYLSKEYIDNLPDKEYLQWELQAIRDRIKEEGRDFLVILKDDNKTKLNDEVIDDDVFELFDEFQKEEILFRYLRRSKLFNIEEIAKRIRKDVESIGKRYLPFVKDKIENIEIKTLEKQISYLNKKDVDTIIKFLLNEKFLNYLESYKKRNEFLTILESNDLKKLLLFLIEIRERLERNRENIISSFEHIDYYYTSKKQRRTSLKNTENMLKEVNQIITKLETISSFYEKRIVLIVGEAFIGKTHFLSNLALRRINSNKPTLLFYGENLKSRTLIQSLKDNLEVGYLTDEEFFKEMDLWGKDLGERVFIIIDAVNETPNLDLWRNELTKLCNFIKKYENIALVLSVRDVEKEKIISEKNEHCIRNEIIEIYHPGFEGIEIKALTTFCKAFGIDLPKIPFHVGKIFINPGMLYIFIETIKELNYKGNFDHINPLLIFELYKENLERKFFHKYEDEIDLDERIVSEGIDEIIEFGLSLENFEFEIDYKEAKRRLKPLHKKLLEFLISEGLLRKIKKKEEAYIKFTYQKFENFYIANYILNKKPELIENIIEERNNMLLEALISLYPKRYKKEIYEDFPEILDKLPLFNLYIRSFYFRDPTTITKEILENIKKIDTENYIELLIYFSIYPNHNFSKYLYKELSSLDLPKRDYFWTISINNIFSKESNLIRQIINWTIENDITDDLRISYGKILTWFLTSSHRELRDKATKSLVNIFTNRLCDFLKLLQEFKNVDDLYILERLYAVLYGVVLRSNNPECIRNIAIYIYENIFNKNFVIEHILLREYASLTLKYILRSADISEIDINKVIPPYNQHIDWTLPDIPKEKVNKYKDKYPAIYFSTLYGDFKRYIIYPAFDDFLDLKIKDKPHKIILEQQEKEERYHKFIKSLNQTQLNLFNKMENNPLLYFLKGEKYDDSIEKEFLNSLSPTLKNEYKSFIKDYDNFIELPRINLKNVKRLIFLETIKLGWKKELFENYEKSLDFTDRYDKRIERIGKKYQWIAYHKVLARISDYYELRNQKGHNDIVDFKGAYQLDFVRDIDPTTILVKKPEKSNNNYRINRNWECLDLSHDKWLKSDKNLPLIEDFVSLGEYINLSTSFSIDGTKNEEGEYRNLYYHIDSFLLEKDKLEDFTNWLKSYHFYGQHKLPQSRELYQIFLREYPNTEVYEYFNDEYYGQYTWTDEYNRIHLPCKILLTSTSYLKESVGYDKSIDKTIFIMLPHKWIVNKMDLQQSLIDGEWINNNHETIIFDPTVKKDKFAKAYKGLLANKDKFLKFLEKENLTIIWIIWGEKQIRAENVGFRNSKVYDIGEICGYGYFDDNRRFVENKWICNKNRTNRGKTK
ncbi:toll/interleukin-1 receptor domain-containing protein [Persephonella sp. KM09-Lau-8]|uniref:toll/interleukin-1 receptor domain-containing protein n=1 Tax=Persephonella sp. KM09-Lau-8 TaxID=1158345 RepID=UPI000497DB0E|nr:toll/interleukin-1 receptor domain-containing protein [Persephonella sp. KM09-Lau-8]